MGGGRSIAPLQLRMPEAVLVDGAKFGLGFQPDFEVAVLRTTLLAPDFPGAQGDGLMGGHVFGLGVDGRGLEER